MPEDSLALLFIKPLREAGARYIVTGSIASIIYGEPRLTHDLDLIVFLNSEQIRRLPELFPPDQFYCPPVDVIAFEAAREHRGHANLIHIPTGFKADLYFAGRDPFHAWAFRMARTVTFAGEPIQVAPPEYVIVRKLEFFREGGSEKHLRDIRLMLKSSGDIIDQAELKQFISERGLHGAWNQVETENP